MEEIDERHPKLLTALGEHPAHRLSARSLQRARPAGDQRARHPLPRQRPSRGRGPAGGVLAQRARPPAAHRRIRARRRHHGRQLLRPGARAGLRVRGADLVPRWPRRPADQSVHAASRRAAGATRADRRCRGGARTAQRLASLAAAAASPTGDCGAATCDCDGATWMMPSSAPSSSRRCSTSSATGAAGGTTAPTRGARAADRRANRASHPRGARWPHGHDEPAAQHASGDPQPDSRRPPHDDARGGGRRRRAAAFPQGLHRHRLPQPRAQPHRRVQSRRLRQLLYGGRPTTPSPPRAPTPPRSTCSATAWSAAACCSTSPRCGTSTGSTPGSTISRRDLEAAERARAYGSDPGTPCWCVPVTPGGWPNCRPGIPRTKAGLHPTAVRFLAERQVTALGSDGNSDAVPSTTEGVGVPVHVLAVHAMGVYLMDYLDLERLATVCAPAGRWEFLVVVAPLGSSEAPARP